jgi:hypothetical protein
MELSVFLRLIHGRHVGIIVDGELKRTINRQLIRNYLGLQNDMHTDPMLP